VTTLALTIDGTQSSILAVIGELDIDDATLDVTVKGDPSEPVIIATYDTLAGPFGDEGDSGWTIDYEANEGTAITLTPPPAGAVLTIR